jgi:SpoVK/Ycf46/Vps4 family AAA+-type ATPase
MLQQKGPSTETAKKTVEQVRTAMESPHLNWLLGFRSGTWWKRIVATTFYLLISLVIVINAGTGNVGSAFIYALILGAVIAVPVIQAKQQAAKGLLAFRVTGSTVFPYATHRMPEDDIWEPWPDLLRRAHRNKEHILFIPMLEGQGAPDCGTESVVTGVSPLFEFAGVRRVQITKTTVEESNKQQVGKSFSQSVNLLSLFFWPLLIARMLFQSSRPASTKPQGAVFRCKFVPLEDRVTPEAQASVEQASRTFKRLSRRFSDGAEQAKNVEGVTDPVVIANRISQAMISATVPLAVSHLKSNDVAWRLRNLLDVMKQAEGAQGAEADVPDFEVEAPDKLPTLADMGGMADLKRQIRETVGLVIQHPEVVEQIGVNFNGVLMYGPPGTGKTFAARATAGEYRMNFLHLAGGDLTSKWMGESEKRIQAAFRTAGNNRPCLLFFDEFDSVASKRGDGGGNEQFQKQVVGQFLKSLEDIRRERGVIVMAATNDIGTLDEAVIRPGRFDQRIRVDLPDPEARKSIFESRLRELPVYGNLHLDDLVQDTEGRSAADLVAIVDAAKLKSLKRAVGQGSKLAAITQQDLEEGLQDRRGKDAPTLRAMTWDDLILPPDTLAQLKSLAELIADPRAGRDIGMKRPAGALLYGPPGTGKTTIARVIASETKGKVSFLPAKGSDLISKFVGDSGKNVRDLFQRARQSSPTIVFIDEIEAMLPKRDADRGQGSEPDSVLTEFLQQLDGIDSVPGVFVLGATNLPDRLDPAVLRGGRLGRKIEIPLPTLENRAQLLKLHTRDIKLADDIDFEVIANQMERFSGGDIEAVCQEAVEHAYDRKDGPQAVTQEDLLAVLRRRRSVKHVEKRGWDDVILPEATKAELRNLAEMISNPEAGREFGLKRPTGALLYGPPGTGKTTVAQVLASQLEGDVGFVSVKGSDLVSKFVGDSAKNVRELFEKARAQTPAIIFIDEIEALVPKRGGEGGKGAEGEAVVTEFLQQLDGIDSTPGVFVLGATNLPDRIDPAILRGGRLGQKIEIPLPTLENRVDLFKLHTRNMKVGDDLDFEALGRQTDRLSGADIESLCQEAGQVAYQRKDGPKVVGQQDFLAALRRRRAVAKIERRSWSDLVLPPDTLRQLQSLARLIGNPDEGRDFGIKPPSGALLYGPPGTGKTTIAQVLATQLAGDVSFVSVKGSDVVSKYVGESAQKVREIFDRARAQSPAILFIDEIDTMLQARGDGNQERESVVTEFLQQLDGLESGKGVFVLGATNLPERLDPAVLRGGRIGRQIEIPLPTEENREELFRRFTGDKAIAPDVDFADLAHWTDGLSGADIESLCADAAEYAFMRDSGPRQVTKADFEAVLKRQMQRQQRGIETTP